MRTVKLEGLGLSQFSTFSSNLTHNEHTPFLCLSLSQLNRELLSLGYDEINCNCQSSAVAE
jgi:hypothetical protein